MVSVMSMSEQYANSAVDVSLKSFLVLNHRNHELRVRLNLGLEWGKNLVGKNKIFKGYKPNRRYFQVGFLDFEVND